MTPTARTIGPILFAAFLAWRVYVRFGRSVGRQPLEPGRLITRIVVFSAISVTIALGLLSSPGMLPYFGGGLLLGVTAGYYITYYFGVLRHVRDKA